MKKLSIFLGTFLAVLFAFGTANATLFLDGKQIYVTYEQPFNTLVKDYGLLTVGPGVEISTDQFGGFFTADISNTNITFKFLQSGYFAPSTSFDGLHFQDTTNTIAGIGSVTINPATNMAGFDANRITSDGNNIWVNFHDLNFNSQTIASVNVAATPTPIPGSLWLLGSGLLGLAGLKRRSSRKA